MARCCAQIGTNTDTRTLSTRSLSSPTHKPRVGRSCRGCQTRFYNVQALVRHANCVKIAKRWCRLWDKSEKTKPVLISVSVYRNPTTVA